MTDDLRAAALAATPGPWAVGYWFGQCHEAHFPHPGGAECKYERTASDVPFGVRTLTPDVTIVSDDDIRPNDAAYIALASPDRILALLDENKELRAALERLQRAVTQYQVEIAHAPGNYSEKAAVAALYELMAAIKEARAALEGKPTG